MFLNVFTLNDINMVSMPAPLTERNIQKFDYDEMNSQDESEEDEMRDSSVQIQQDASYYLERSSIVSLGKIILFFVQIQVSVNSDFWSQLAPLYSSVSQDFKLHALECDFGDALTPARKLLASLLLPIFVGVLISLLTAIRKVVRILRKQKDQVSWKDEQLFLLMITSYVHLYTLSVNLLSTLNCKDDGLVGFYMKTIPWLKCDWKVDDYKHLATYTALGGAEWFILLFLLVLIYKLKMDESRRIYICGFLYVNYHMPGNILSEWFEFLLIGCRVFVSIAITVIPSEDGLSNVFVLISLLLIVVIHSAFDSVGFLKKSDNTMNQISLLLICLTFASQISFAQIDAAKYAAYWIVVSLDFLFLIVCIIFIILATLRRRPLLNKKYQDIHSIDTESEIFLIFK